MIDLLKFNKPEQYPVDEILNDKDRLVRSWMSVEVRDRQGDIVPIDQLKKVMNTWMKRGATMMDQHSNRPIGKGLKWELKTHEETQKPAILLDYQVFDDYSVDDKVWEEIKGGKRTGLSIGGRALGKPEMKADDFTGKDGRYLNDLELYEVSPVDGPANQYGLTTAVNYLAKGIDIKKYEEELLMDLTKGFAVIEIQKPFAGFQNFEEAVKAQMERGHSRESADRIAGWLMHRTEKTFKQEGFQNEVESKGNPGQIGPEKLQSNDSVDTGENMEIGKYDEDSEAPRKTHEPRLDDSENYSKDQRAKGIAEESKEHPEISAKEIAQLVDDHLKEDPEFYNKNIAKRRVYLKPGMQAPKGANVQTGQSGGKFYETQAQQGTKPGNKFDTPGSTPAEQGQMRSRAEVTGKPQQGQKPKESPYDQFKPLEQLGWQDAEGKTIYSGDDVTIPQDLTTDPYDKRGQKGVITGYNPKSESVRVKFEDGSEGLYSADAVISDRKSKSPDTSAEANDNNYRARTGKDPNNIPEAGNKPDIAEREAQSKKPKYAPETPESRNRAAGLPSNSKPVEQFKPEYSKPEDRRQAMSDGVKYEDMVEPVDNHGPDSEDPIADNEESARRGGAPQEFMHPKEHPSYKALKEHQGKMQEYNDSITNEAKRLADEMGIDSSESVIGSTPEQQYYFIQGAKGRKSQKTERDVDQQRGKTPNFMSSNKSLMKALSSPVKKEEEDEDADIKHLDKKKYVGMNNWNKGFIKACTSKKVKKGENEDNRISDDEAAARDRMLHKK